MAISIELVQKGNRRYYSVTGDPSVEGLQLPSVTTIVNAVSGGGGGLAIWAERLVIEWLTARLTDELSQPGADAKACVLDALDKVKGITSRQRDAAADKGTEIHKYAEQVLSGSMPEIPMQYYQAISNMWGWFRTTGLDPRLGQSEKKVYSAISKYAGTIDYRGVDDKGRIWIVDFKSGNNIYPKTAMQLAAYAAADEEMTGQPPYKAIAVKLSQEADGFEVKEADWRRAYEAFRYAKILYETQNKLWLPSKKEKQDA